MPLPALRIDPTKRQFSSVSALPHCLLETVKKFGLALKNFAARDFEIEPGSPIDFRKVLSLPRTRRPLDAERIADERRRVPIAVDRPGVHPFSSGLPQRTKRQGFPRRTKSGLFREFPKRRGEKVLTVVDFSLWHCPGACILGSPVGSARMCEKNLESGAVPV